MKKSFLRLITLTVLVLSLFLVISCGDDTTDSSTPTSDPGTVDSSGTQDSNTTQDSNGTQDSSGTQDSTPDSEKDDYPLVDGTVTLDDIKLLNINYKTMTYVGTSLKDFAALFDEQTVLNDPWRDKNDIEYAISLVPRYDADGNGDVTAADEEHIYEITIDLGADFYIECVYAFFSEVGDGVVLEFGTPFAYERSYSADSTAIGWREMEIKDTSRCINVKVKNGHAPCELLFYGARVGEYDAPITEKHEYKTFDYLLGINGNQSDSTKTLSCARYFRDYVNWLWCFDRSNYPTIPGTTFNTYMASKYDVKYEALKESGISTVPCYMFTAESFPVEKIEDYMKPETYVQYAELLTQTAIRFGNNPNNTRSVVKILDNNKNRFNKDTISWIEAGNEPNGEGNDGFSPYELAALTSMCYDGHAGAFKESPAGSILGVKVADPNMNMAMAGLAGVGTRYIQAMAFWMKHNRNDGQVGLDAFNVHTYCKKLIRYNGYQVYVGVCPEIGKITEYVQELTAWRDKYYPTKEVWLTEFGWDTNTSYATENACHPYGDFTAREIQAMWLVRAYFMFASVGVDRAAMYMASDLGDEATSVGKYGTSGVISNKGEYKDSYYYIYTLKNTMGDMRFAEIIDSGNENVWIYRFENDNGKSCYAVWCPTMDDIRVNDFVLSIDGTKATLTEFANLEKSGISSELTVTNGTVTVNVGERPILVFSE